MEKINQVLEYDIPYRMHAVHSLPASLRIIGRYNTDEIMDIVISNMSILVGNLNNYTNPSIESGVIHGRALLEFLGLGEHSGRLVCSKKRRPSDIGIESFGLQKVTPEAALELCSAKFSGVNEDAFVTLIHLANKGIAHTTSSLVIPKDQASQLTIAAECIIFLMQNCLYSGLGKEQIKFKFAKL
ncbi:hypothetical protein WAE56_19195 [Iodobacter sp. LRB]|uniref:hypothetical protein n=1 Tax=unclassified Iodobacter TaxID=235634 RepID=UPI000C11D8F2|nr:hypothetical protein [Iodobacter sp. BJB302]PHV02326.1 hypothetical protein CSQ88_07280 [Iodobacter sp. BJB302]